MDPLDRAQVLLLCDLCQKAALQSHCEFCQISLCKACVKEHLSDKFKHHIIVPYRYRVSDYPKCQIHSQDQCKFYCDECDIARLITAVTTQGEYWHKEINSVVDKQKSEIGDLKKKLLIALDEQENEIKKNISELEKSILDLKKILDSSDISLTSAYKTRNAEFRSLPPKVNVTLPKFSPFQIISEQLYKIFGSLSSTDEQRLILKTPAKSFLAEPELITTIDTGMRSGVACLSDEEVWTCGGDYLIRLYNLQGEVLKLIQTKTDIFARGIAVTRSDDLVYIDDYTRTVNIVRDNHISEVIRLVGWRPLSVCSTSSGDLLVTMNSDDNSQSKVVRYSGSTEKQTIQFDSEGKPLYSSDAMKYMCENRNLDICVSDIGASAVVVVNQTGNLRFRYTGHPSTDKKSFEPWGITTDSQNQILISDADNACIHILDQDGQFLRYIDNCDLFIPNGLCVDIRDNLFVANWSPGNVKKIKYMQTGYQ
ncbi:uncharacterized protein LOC134266111 [Saccostrea cucullata]|uniref:uncharacterized protein LOC134266111 n=1 Tax=Saccostrea cuccullata TaxID=36930 RepID=UPI002ED50121